MPSTAMPSLPEASLPGYPPLQCASELASYHPKVARLAHNPVSVLPAGKFYTLLTGANERRWEKMKDKVSTTWKSFEVSLLL